MSFEYRPLQRIAFDTLFDGRLEPYGVRAECGPEYGLLSMPDGECLTAKRDGDSTSFEFRHQEMPLRIFRFLQFVYGAEFVGEEDYRFWGFPSLEAMNRGEGSSTVFTYTPNDGWIVIEGPSPDDVDFTISWLEAAREAERLWLRHASDAPEANNLWDELCSHNPIYRGASDRPDVGFSTAAMAFVRKWLKSRASFVLNVSGSRWPELFCLMVFAGFFVATGDRYQMAIPHPIDVRKIYNSLSEWLNRSDEGSRHSENLLLTLTEHEAKSWEARLRHMISYQRLADRAILLASPT